MGAFSVITAVGRDRPGIVAGMTEALWRLGCNLEDTSMTLLRSEFAMILVVRRPTELSPEKLDEAVREVGAALGLHVASKELSDEEALPEPRTGGGYALSVYGADRPGIVYRVASVLAGHGVNITDLSTRVLESHRLPVYVMLFDLDVPVSVAEETLRAALNEVASEVSITVSLRPVDEQAL